jgi:hypothetical protein
MKELNTGLPAPSQEDLFFHRLIDEFMKKFHIKNGFFMDCNLRLKMHGFDMGLMSKLTPR